MFLFFAARCLDLIYLHFPHLIYVFQEMIFEATFYLLTGSVVLIVSFAWMASNGRLKPQITSGGGPSVFVESLNGQLFRFFMTLTLVAIVSGGLSSLLTGDRQMAGFSL